MKISRYRRNTFYALNGHKDFADHHSNFVIELEEATLVADAVSYLMEGACHTRFPGAARAVAIATAQFLTENFGEDFYENLSDPELMQGNDPYFKTYQEDQKTYDAILQQVSLGRINWNSYRMQVTRQLLAEEYMLDEDGLRILEAPTDG
ncbi:MAG: hypothetical protein KF789_08495 [Bdellovibrionaceae bacterium]|nr:hypothetical protein [Pseudobdellovibrionaceae bacterium]